MTDSPRPVDESILSDALVRYIGEGLSVAPADDVSAVAIAYPTEAHALHAEITRILVLSETVRFDDVGPFDQGLRDRLYARIRNLVPGLSDDAVGAVGWRWGFLNLR